MRDVTEKMIKKYMILENKIDFMGYFFCKKEELSFHHLIVPKSKCEMYGIQGGYYEWNGAILVKETSHNYLHLIERVDRIIFEKITDILIEENKDGKLDKKYLREINNQLLYFERNYGKEKAANGDAIIKPEYCKRLIKKHGIR